MTTTLVTPRSKPTLAPLQCVKCNAPLVVVDAPSLVCRFCGAGNEMPPAYREELRLTRDLDLATRAAAEQWLRLAHIKVPRWWLVLATLGPFVWMTGGLIILFSAALSGMISAKALPAWSSMIWLPLIPAQLLAAHIAMKNVLVSGATSVGLAFAASPASAPGEPPHCRQCGALLTVEAGDILVRCIYCDAESIVQLDESAMKTLRTRVTSAQTTLAEAMTALRSHARLAGVETRGRTYVIAGLLVLPLVWSFVASWNSSYWGLAIALDVFVLAICVFWNVREALLPPVTIEELETVMDSSDRPARSTDAQTPRAAGTRAWYNNAFDKINFIVPLVMTLMFLALQVLVVRANHRPNL